MAWPFRLLLWLLGLALLVFIALLANVMIREARVCREAKYAGEYDAIIVLGAQVLPDGTPNVQLSLRLDAAANAWQLHRVPVVVCGAQGTDEPRPEAEIMKDYLIGQGVDGTMILMDPDSFNTEQNIRNAAMLLSAYQNVRRVLIVSSDYHVPRAMALASDLGFDATGLGAPILPEYWLKNHARESLAWVKYWLNKYLHLSL